MKKKKITNRTNPTQSKNEKFCNVTLASLFKILISPMLLYTGSRTSPTGRGLNRKEYINQMRRMEPKIDRQVNKLHMFVSD